MSRIRVATGALSGRIYAGTLTKDGQAFREGKQDVTSDAIKAVIDHLASMANLGPGNPVTIEENGVPKWRIRIEEVPGDS